MNANEPIAEVLGRLLARKSRERLADASHVDVIKHTALLLSGECSLGNSCIDIASTRGGADVTGGTDSALPALDIWRSTLLASGVCRDDGASAPLVLDGNRLYLRRFHAAEKRLAASIRDRLAPRVDGVEPVVETVSLFRALFKSAIDDADWQAVAAAAALRSSLVFITGGPGTGKTTVAARILALLLQQNPSRRIALAAPTGRAAGRISEAVLTAANDPAFPHELRSRLPTQGTTLHRLLGYQPWNNRFRFGPHNQLLEDVIVVDEASMVDLLMTDTLFAAVRPDARLIILGDPDQLASVDTGFVLGDVARAANASGDVHGAELGMLYERLSGTSLATAPEAPPLRDAVIRLRHSYRFSTKRGIGNLAAAIQREDTDDAIDTLADTALADVSRIDRGDRIDELLAPIAPPLESFLSATSPVDALAALGRFRMLCALRDGPTGVSGLNEGIERWLKRRGYNVQGWYDHRPVLVVANDPVTGLYNGDVGVTMSPNGRPEVFFPGRGGAVRSFRPSSLPQCETAWAMTVHKAQGSEFDHVLMVLPDADSRMLTRELLYTAVTRAKESMTLAGSEEAVRLAIGRSTARSSGLTERLR